MEVHEIPWISMDFHGHFRRHEDNGRNCISRMTCAADALCNPNNTYYSNIRTGIKTRPISSGGFKYVVFYMFYSLWEWKENPYQLPSNEIDSHNFLRKICREIKGIFCSYETGANVNNSNCNSSLHQVTSWNSSRNYVPVILDGLSNRQATKCDLIGDLATLTMWELRQLSLLSWWIKCKWWINPAIHTWWIPARLHP